MNQLFISYSRKDTEFARRLHESIVAQGLEAWVDWQDIPPSVDWMNEIKKGIEEANIFLFLVSPDSVSSPVCAEEVGHAVLNGKRIIPIIVRDINVETTPSTITHLNWIFFSRPQDVFEESINKVMTAIQTDYDWVEAHRRIQVKALEWDRNKRENSFLLRGKDLQDAEAQLTVNEEKLPHPTDLQREFVSKSTEVETEQLEQQRAKQQQLELEKRMGGRLRRLTYLMLGVFTVAFIALFFWLNTVTRDLADQSIKDQMLALVETSSCFFNIQGDSYQEFVEYFSAENTAVYEDYFYSDLINLLSDIKATNVNVKTNINIYTIVQGSAADEYLVVVNTNEDIKFKTPKSDSSNSAFIAGMKKTTVNQQPYTNQYGTWISACSPITNSNDESIGALCADFNAQLLDDTRALVTKTLGFAFLAIYPAMILLVISSTRSVSNMMDKVKKSA